MENRDERQKQEADGGGDAEASTGFEEMSDDPTDNPEFSTPRPSAQFLHRSRSCFNINDASLELSLPQSRDSTAWVPGNTQVANTTDNWSIHKSASATELHQLLGDPTVNPGSSTPDSPVQVLHQFQSCFNINDASSELSLPESGASLSSLPDQVSHTTDSGSFCAPTSSIELQRVLTPVTFDEASAQISLNISKDLKTVTVGMIPLKPSEGPAEPQRFHPSRCVLGSPGFSTGRHTWEVELSGPISRACIVGVAWEQVPRKGKLTLEPKNGFWVLRITSTSCQALTGSNSWKTLQFYPKRVGVCVDLEGEEVNFYDAVTKDHIYTFHTSFPGKIFPFFMLLFSGTWITLNP